MSTESSEHNPFLELPGAVQGSAEEARVAAHYGNPASEQRALVAGEAVVDLSNRGVLTISGPDRLTWLDSVTSQDLKGLGPGASSETLLLDATGRIQHAIRVLDDGVCTWLLVDAAQTEPLAAWLESMRFMLRVEVADRSADYATIGTLGSPALEPAAPNGVPLQWRDPWPEVSVGGHQYAAADEHPAPTWTYREILIERTRLAEAAQLRAAGVLALEALRIAAWRPRQATEVDERTIPHELDWLRSAVHLNKGCYRGQETVAKVHNLGHPPRRLVMLHLDGSDAVLPLVGDDVTLPGEGADEPKVVGRVTSVGRHFELGPIALAVVRRGTDPSATLHVRVGTTDVAAAQEVIVPTDAGATAPPPRLPRLGRSES